MAINITVEETIETVDITTTVNETIVNVTRQSGGGGAVDSVNGQTGVVVLTTNEVADSSNKRYVSDTEKTAITHANRSILDAITESFTTALKNAYDASVTWISTNGTNLINHLTNTSNPHNTTALQVGAYTTSETDTLLNAKANISGQVFSGPISATNLSNTNTGDETTLSIQTKRPLKTVNSQSLEGSGNITIEAFEQYQKTLPTRLTTSTNIDTWRGWTSLANFMTADANSSFGVLTDATFVAGTVAGLLVKNKTALSYLSLMWSSMGVAEIEVQVWLYDIDNTQVSPGARFTNPRKVVSQTFIPQSNTTDEFSMTIASHTLTATSKFYLFYRFKNASVTPSGFVENIMFKFRFI